MATAISKVSKYAADPAKFVKYRGGVVNQRAVRVGNRGHWQAGVKRKPLLKISVLVLIGAACWFLLFRT